MPLNFNQRPKIMGKLGIYPKSRFRLLRWIMRCLTFFVAIWRNRLLAASPILSVGGGILVFFPLPTYLYCAFFQLWVPLPFAVSRWEHDTWPSINGASLFFAVYECLGFNVIVRYLLLWPPRGALLMNAAIDGSMNGCHVVVGSTYFVIFSTFSRLISS